MISFENLKMSVKFFKNIFINLLVIWLGAFTISSQTLLFREFLSTFESNDINIGIFFFSWFLWISFGAFSYTLFKSYLKNIVKKSYFRYLVIFLYILSFIIQFFLILNIRNILDIKSYDVLQIWNVIFLSILINGFISFLTGILFPTFTNWGIYYYSNVFKNHNSQNSLFVSNIYIFEALGSFIGGILVTLLLWLNFTPVNTFFIILILSLFVLLSYEFYEKRKKYIILDFFILLLIFSLFFIFGNRITRFLNLKRWSQYLPKDSYKDYFQTSKATYLYGNYNNQFIVIREGNVIESFPNKEISGKTIALFLSQYPKAKNVFIITYSFDLIYRFSLIETIKSITWYCPDREYSQFLLSLITRLKNIKFNNKKISILEDYNVRKYLKKLKNKYDIAILDISSLSSNINKYYTLEFFKILKNRLNKNGVLGIKVKGGENIIGEELAILGATLKKTLEEVFKKVIIKPGETTWFISSDNNNITNIPWILVKRLNSIKNINKIFPPKGIFTLFQEEKVKYAEYIYNEINKYNPKDIIINKDFRPLAYFYSILASLKRFNINIINFFKRLAVKGEYIFFIIIGLFIFIRCLYVYRLYKNNLIDLRNEKLIDKIHTFDAYVLTFIIGIVSISINLILIYIYQTLIGSIFLDIGIISSFFMIGLTIGGEISKNIISIKKLFKKIENYLIFNVFFYVFILLFIFNFNIINLDNKIIFIFLFFIIGCLNGIYFPISVEILKSQENDNIAYKLEISDHLGACIGGIITPLILLPLLGLNGSIIILIMLLILNIVPFVFINILSKIRIKSYKKKELKPILYFLLYINILAVSISLYISYINKKYFPIYKFNDIKKFAKSNEIRERKSGKILYYEILNEKDSSLDSSLKGYIFFSKDFTPDIYGYGGPINILIYTNKDGILKNFYILKSNETPSYLEYIKEWMENLKGKNIFKTYPKIDTVSGATLSSKAIYNILFKSGHKFYKEVLLKEAKKEKFDYKKLLPDIRGVYLLSFILLSLLFMFSDAFNLRKYLIFLSFIIGGIILNTQYSSNQIVLLLDFSIFNFSLNSTFVLLIIVPIITIFFGNIYCGYICPFGGLQESIYHLTPKKFKLKLNSYNIEKIYSLKYIILTIIVCLFFVTHDFNSILADPLVNFFSFNWNHFLFFIGFITFIGSLFYFRFWCRFLCPVGGFLTFLSFILPFKIIPKKLYNTCSYREFNNICNCLVCGRECISSKVLKREEKIYNKTFTKKYIIVWIIGVFIIFYSIYSVFFIPTQNLKNIIIRKQLRKVDIKRIKRLIKEGKLSNKEALYYKKLDNNEKEKKIGEK